MKIRELAVPHSFEFTPVVHADERGEFVESFRADLLEEATGRRFDLRQSNISVSRAGAARGVHFANVPNGQAKYVTAVNGTVLDYVIDLRVGSPTFGASDTVELDDVLHRAVFISEGIGHVFIATSPMASVVYLTNDVYRPDAEHTVLLRDPALRLKLPARPLLLSPRDEMAPTLAIALEAGLLPDWSKCLEAYSRHAV